MVRKEEREKKHIRREKVPLKQLIHQNKENQTHNIEEPQSLYKLTET